MRMNRDETRMCQHRWKKYVVSGAASSLAALGAGNNAEADFTFIEVNVELSDTQPGDGAADTFGPYMVAGTRTLFCQHAFESPCCSRVGVMYLGGNVSFAAHVFGTVSNPLYWFPHNFSAGATIGNYSGYFVNPVSERAGTMAFGFGWTAYSQFRTQGIGYIGFQFDVGNGTQYGFAEVDMSGAPENTAQLIGYGWGDPGEAVFAGQRPIPEPGSLGMLALGGMALLMWRKKRGELVG